MRHEEFDLVVLGSGAAAKSVAFACRDAGWRVAVVDRRPFGGTCALRGCDPKKVLVGAAAAVDQVRRLAEKGVEPGGARVRWQALIAFKRQFTEPVPGQTREALEEKGIVPVRGEARFVDRETVRVGDRTLTARHFHVATGAEPADLPFDGAHLLTTSDGFLELYSLPERVVFVGGGYVSFEFAHVAALAGARVSLLHRGPRPLKRFDPDLVSMLVDRSRKLGIDVRLQHEVARVERRGDGVRVHTRSDEGEHTFDADLAVHGAGRVPAIRALDLAAGGVEVERGGVKVDDHLRSVSNPRVYAGGDAAAVGAPLTPVASDHARVVAANLLGEARRLPDVPTPSVVFTTPPLAKVGVTEAEAREQGLDFTTHAARTADWYSARRVAEPCAGHKVLVEEGSGRLLGAHLVGPEASELVNLFALAMGAGMTADALKATRFAYPTAASDISHML